MRRLALGFTAAALVLWFPISAAAQGQRVVEVVDLQGVIDPTTAGYLETQIEDAVENGSEAVIIQLDTPGGLSVSMDDMVDTIVNATIPVIVWVGPPGARAASAGVFLVYASDVAAMAEATNLGAAHPVNLGGDLSDAQEDKAVNDAVAKLRSLARLRDRDEGFAESSIRDSESITADEAEDGGVVEIIANSIPGLLEQLDGRTVETETGPVTLTTQGQDVTVRFHEPGFFNRLLHAITDPTVAYLLLVLGFWAIVFEISQPGMGIAGIAGAVALIMAFYSLAVLPVSIAGLLLVLLGLVLFTIDVFTAGLGVFTVGGTLSLGLGSVLLFAGVSPAIRVSPWLIVAVVVASVLFFGFAMTAALRVRRRQSVTGGEGMIGLVGESRADLAPEGHIWVKGALWRARALNGHIPQGRRVRVRRVDGLLLLVQEEREERSEEE